MGHLLAKIHTYGAANRFRFNCPIFGAEVEMRQCLQLRDEWAKGKRIEQRRGCQACLSASKCPIVHIIARIQADPAKHDVYHSDEPKVGKLRPEILERIARIVVCQHTLNAYQPIPDGQMARIDAVNGLKGVEAMAKNVGVPKAELEAVIEAKSAVYDYEPPPTPKRQAQKPKPKAEGESHDAAASGDLSAVVNKMMQAPAVEPAPAPTPEPPKVERKPEPVTGSKPLSLLERARLAKEGKAA